MLLSRILCLLLCFSLFGCKHKQVVSEESDVRSSSNKAVANTRSNLDSLKQYSLEFKVGQMIMMGINDRKSLEAGDELVEEIQTGKTGGVIYFEKNISGVDSKSQLKKLSSDLQALAQVPLFISIDEEGGKVHRLKEKYGMIKMPSAAYLGKLNNDDSTLYYNRQLAKLMQELGINLNFAPDVDLALNPDNPVIAKVERSFSADPLVVTRQADDCIKAHHEYGIKTVLKHFPGHGSSATDSHYGITDVTKQWKFTELIPYKRLIASGDCDAIMTAHIVNCRLDTTCLPATLSKPIISDVLRGILGFDGVVFSDDMQMHAISKNYGLENAIKLSILSGVDVLVFGNNVTQTYRTSATEVHAIIMQLIKSGAISEERIHESFVRIMTLKNKKFN